MGLNMAVKQNFAEPSHCENMHQHLTQEDERIPAAVLEWIHCKICKQAGSKLSV